MYLPTSPARIIIIVIVHECIHANQLINILPLHWYYWKGWYFIFATVADIHEMLMQQMFRANYSVNIIANII